MRRILTFAVAALVLVLTLLPAGAAEEEIVENWPDGTVKLRYTVDEDGRRDGKFAEFFASGKPKLKCAYRAGKLHGSYSSYFENGRRHITTAYRDGELHGKYAEKAADRSAVVTCKYDRGKLNGERIFYRGKTVRSEQQWKKGRLTRLDGIVPHPRTRDDIDRVRQEISASGSRPEDSAAADREDGLRVLKEYRYLVGVPYAELSLDEELNARTQAAAELLRRFGDLSHEPPNPGLPADEYRYALLGTRNSSLSTDGSSPASIHGYMDDSDPTNIDNLGHRSWCVNPVMRKTGFGVAGEYTAMWTIDASGGADCEFDLITYPARGYMPADLFGARHAFSVWAAPGGRSGKNLSKVKAEIYALDENYIRADQPLPMGHRSHSTGKYGPGPALIFRPKSLDVEPGSRYAVVLKGLDVKRPYWFLVEFF